MRSRLVLLFLWCMSSGAFAISYQVDNTCYESSSLAIKAMAAREVGRLVNVGTSLYSVAATSTTAMSVTYTLTDVASTATIVKTYSYFPMACGKLDTADALSMAWGVAGAWLITAGILFLRRGLQT